MTPFMPSRDIYTVSRLNQDVRALLEGEFPSLWVEGEVSNLSRPSSGHLYFSLKDARAQIRCALFQNRALLFRDCPRNGQQVLVRGRVSLYEPRGDFQIIVEYVEEAGAGALRRAYDALRLKLEREGLFAPERKQPLPRFPRRIGVITSPTGAAIRDVLTTLRRRCPGLPVLIYPVPVQGDGAAERIANAIRLASAAPGLRRVVAGARRRFAGGFAGFQRRNRGAGDLRLPDPAGDRHRPRNRCDHRRFRRRSARRYPHGGGGTGQPRPAGMAAPGSPAGRAAGQRAATAVRLTSASGWRN